MSGVKAVHLLTLGWERLPKAWSIDGWDPSDITVEPVPGVLVEVDGGFVLLDTGFNSALIKDPALYKRFHGNNENIAAILPDGIDEPLLDSLDRLGLSSDDVIAVVVSHLHNDHAGGLKHFTTGQPIYVQQLELEYGMSEHPGPERNGIFQIDYNDPRLNFVKVNGHESESEVSVVPGISVIPTFGHTPGHQSVIVEFAEASGGAGFVFAFDAGDLRENFTNEWAIGGTIDCDPALTVRHIRRLKALAHERGLILVPGHDPVLWPRLTSTLDSVANHFPVGLTTEALFSD